MPAAGVVAKVQRPSRRSWSRWKAPAKRQSDRSMSVRSRCAASTPWTDATLTLGEPGSRPSSTGPRKRLKRVGWAATATGADRTASVRFTEAYRRRSVAVDSHRVRTHDTLGAAISNVTGASNIAPDRPTPCAATKGPNHDRVVNLALPNLAMSANSAPLKTASPANWVSSNAASPANRAQPNPTPPENCALSKRTSPPKEAPMNTVSPANWAPSNVVSRAKCVLSNPAEPLNRTLSKLTWPSNRALLKLAAPPN